jgi:hypothetical protein
MISTLVQISLSIQYCWLYDLINKWTSPVLRHTKWYCWRHLSTDLDIDTKSGSSVSFFQPRQDGFEDEAAEPAVRASRQAVQWQLYVIQMGK